MTATFPVRSKQAADIVRTRLKQLSQEHDCTSYRSLGEKLGVDYSYLYRIANGEKCNPSPKFLAKLGLKKVVTYERI